MTERLIASGSKSPSTAFRFVALLIGVNKCERDFMLLLTMYLGGISCCFVCKGLAGDDENEYADCVALNNTSAAEHKCLRDSMMQL